MFQDLFRQIGLTPNEALIYDFLLKKGTLSAGEIIKNTPLKRGVVYNTLKDLIKKELVLSENRQKVAFFAPNHPQKLLEIAENQENELQKAEKNLHANLPTLTSAFSLVSNQPGVRFFEGENGLKKALEDTLSAQETICTFVDVEAVVKYIDKINQDYVKKREKLNKQKKMICVDSPFNRNYLKDYHIDVTDTRFVDYLQYPFSSVMQIYDNKVAFVSLSANSIFSVLISDKNIYQMNRMLFNFFWSHSKPFSALGPLTKSSALSESFSKTQ